MGACGNEELVIRDLFSACEQDLMSFAVQPHGFLALHPVHSISIFKISLHKTKSLLRPMSSQIGVQDAAGIDIFIL